jgi:sodium/potassium/calcium exchanger 6
MGMRLLVGLIVIGAACGLAPGNVTDDAVVSERWWGGDDATDDVVDDGAREHFCRGSKIARYREETNLSSSCAVVEAYCGGRGEGLFQYMHLRYCALGAAPGAATVALLALWLLLLISLLATTADCYFVPQLEALSGYLQLSPEVAGITLLALGNGQGRKRERNSQLQRLLSRPFSTRFG